VAHVPELFGDGLSSSNSKASTSSKYCFSFQKSGCCAAFPFKHQKSKHKLYKEPEQEEKKISDRNLKEQMQSRRNQNGNNKT
jgi:hypothetical protein